MSKYQSEPIFVFYSYLQFSNLKSRLKLFESSKAWIWAKIGI